MLENLANRIYPDCLEKRFTISGYFKNSDDWHDNKEYFLEKEARGFHVVSVITLDNNKPSSASYYFSDGTRAGDSIEDDLEGVKRLWTL